MNRCKNNLEKSSTTNLNEHIPSGFFMSAKSPFKDAEHKDDVDRGKD